MLSRSTCFLKREFENRGYTVTSFDDPYLLHVSKGKTSFYTNAAKGPLLSAATYMICKNKYLTREVLEKFHFQNPQYALVTKYTVEKVSHFHFPVVVKPLLLEGGEGVEINVPSVEGVVSFFEKHPHYDQVIVEEMLEGEDVRVLIVRGKFFAAVKRRPAFIIGDGSHTIQELVEQENGRRSKIFDLDLENQTYTTDLDLILFDEEAKKVVEKQGYGLNTILANGQELYVRENANTSTGGISIDVTDQVCDAIRTQCEALAGSLCMSLAGIDIMTKDLSKPLNIQEKSGVIEVNSSPGLDLHILTDEGVRRNPVPLIVDEIEEYFQKNAHVA